MESNEISVQQLEVALERLPAWRRREVLLFIEFLECRMNTEQDEHIPSADLWQTVGASTAEAPLYRIHEEAAITGISDLADEHDLYLYGTAKQNG
jgi:hypothetical protein